MVMNYPSEVQMQINARINGKYSDVAQTEADLRLIYNRDDATLQYRLEASLEPHLNVSLNNSCASESPRPCTTTTPCPRTGTTTTTQEGPHTPATTCTSQPSPLVFADRDSGVVFSSGLIRASGDRVTAHEFRKARTRGGRRLAPTLHLVIPSPSAAALTTITTEQQQAPSEKDVVVEGGSCPSLPSFALTLASPITPRSPIHPQTDPPNPFTRASYYAQVARAPRHPTSRNNNTTRRMRIPYLPQYCAHTLRPFVPITSSNCPLCAIQLLACETWWNSRSSHTHTHTHTHTPRPPSSNLKHRDGLEEGEGWPMSMMMLCAPQVLPADCTPTTRAIFYALGLPLGRLDESCVDWDVVDAIMFIPSRPLPRRSNSKKPAAVRGSSSSRIRVLFRRARHFFTLKIARH
ncbi:hypothetical protein BJV77DRAFT_772103 [Russula vinacea]|nr:hypothetical protein BJV77DRAFT_772103 [Russula vinacea]